MCSRCYNRSLLALAVAKMSQRWQAWAAPVIGRLPVQRKIPQLNKPLSVEEHERPREFGREKT